MLEGKSAGPDELSSSPSPVVGESRSLSVHRTLGSEHLTVTRTWCFQPLFAAFGSESSARVVCFGSDLCGRGGGRSEGWLLTSSESVLSSAPVDDCSFAFLPVCSPAATSSS